jgi:methylated-DNA-[protein]-cysteine S-methyltransferase
MEFGDKCYKILKQVPRGSVITYKAIAEKIGGKAYRAVGSAMNKNMRKDVPCHRVVNSDGRVGGFARGVREKIRLLRKDGIEVKNGRVDLKRYGYYFRLTF